MIRLEFVMDLFIINFDKENLSYLRKNEFTLLEEVINTKETEMIIDIIRSFLLILYRF